MNSKGSCSRLVMPFRRSALRGLLGHAVALVAFWVIGGCADCTEPLSVDIYVSPTGDDSFQGTEQQPFKTIGRARDAVRVLLKNGHAGGVRVQLRGGEYRLNETVVFTTEDSAPEGETVTYQAYPGEKPIISSGVLVTGWSKADQEPRGLSRAARGKVWSAPCPVQAKRFFTLYQGYEILPRSRAKGFLPPSKANAYKNEIQDELRYPKRAVRSGSNTNGWELFAITAAPWSMNILPIESIDKKARLLKTSVPGSYALSQPKFGEFEESAWIENSFAGLDEPGEWVLDHDEGVVYLWPKKGKKPAGIVAPTLTELFRIEGTIDYHGPQDEPVRGIEFKGLTFTRGDRYLWDKSGQGYGLQHDWEVFDAPTAMVRLRGAEDCTIEGCRFLSSGASAVRLDLHCQNNRVASNRIGHVGGAGIVLAGYGPGTKDVNRGNHVTNNHIHNIGELYWHSPGIMVWQSGENVVANNLIHNTPYSGIVVSGRIVWKREGNGDCVRTIRWNEVDGSLGTDYKGWPDWYSREPFLHARNNRVVRNEVHHAVEVLSDGNGIYVSGAGGGNVVRENYVHDCPSKLFLQGIRCDDDQHETIIDRNILYRLGGWSEFIISKGKNHITGNLLAVPLNPPKRGMLVLKPTEANGVNGSLVQRNLFYTNRRGDKIVDQSPNANGHRGLMHLCDADRNTYYNSAQPEWAKKHLMSQRNHRSELNSIESDPRLLDIEGRDFALRQDSPARRLGFEPIDIRTIGLLNAGR